MPYIKPKNPYSAGYALPKNALAEGVRGTITTPWAPRGTIDSYRPEKGAWASGYALPKNVLAETPGKGVNVTPWAPRGTIDAYVSPTYLDPEPMSSPKNHGLGSLGGGLGDSSLGDADAKPGKDVIASGGLQMADKILATVAASPVSERAQDLRDILNGIRPGMANDVDAKLAKLKAREPGISPKAALRRAIAAACANRMVESLVEMGRTGRPVAMGCDDCDDCDCNPQDLAGFKSWVKKAAKKTKNVVKKGVNAYRDVMCKVLSSSGAKTAAQFGGAAAGGGPQGGQMAGAGVDIGKSVMCRDKGAPAAKPQQMIYSGGGQQYAAPSAPASNNTLLIVGGVAAAGLVVFLATRK